MHLAINGGSRAAEGLRVPKWPLVGEEERTLLSEVLESQQWGRFGGAKVEQFEQAFGEYQGPRYRVAVSNGTVALELALRAVGVRPLDEVIVPSVTFVASATAVVCVGAIPVFADADPDTGVMSTQALEQVASNRTTAAMVVHYGGHPCDLDQLPSLARRIGLALVEDCAHAHGTQWRGIGVGSFGRASGFSFQAGKALTCGEGGMVMTDDENIAERAKLIHHIGRRLGSPGYEHHVVGSNYRMTEFQAAVALAQLRRLPAQVSKRASAANFLLDKLGNVGGLIPQKHDRRITRRGFYFLVFRYCANDFAGVPRDRFVEALRAEGVPCHTAYRLPVYRQPAFRRERLASFYARGTKLPDYEATRLPGAEAFCAEQVVIPHAVLLADEKGLRSIVDAVEKLRTHSRELL